MTEFDTKAVLVLTLTDPRLPTLGELADGEDVTDWLTDGHIVVPPGEFLLIDEGVLVVRKDYPSGEPWAVGQPVECVPVKAVQHRIPDSWYALAITASPTRDAIIVSPPANQ